MELGLFQGGDCNPLEWRNQMRLNLYALRKKSASLTFAGISGAKAVERTRIRNVFLLYRISANVKGRSKFKVRPRKRTGTPPCAQSFIEITKRASHF
jgi:hypothetical protein